MPSRRTPARSAARICATWGRRSAALEEFAPRARRVAARFLAPAHHAEEPVAAARSCAGGGFAGAHRRDVSRRSDQYHRAARRAAHRAAFGVRRSGGDPGGSERLATKALALRRRRSPRREARGDGQEIQARGEHRHRRLGSWARCSCARRSKRSGAATSRRISSRTWTARSSRT